MGMFAQPCEYIKTNEMYVSKIVNFKVYELYLHFKKKICGYGSITVNILNTIELYASYSDCMVCEPYLNKAATKKKM